jgi:two-component sensor histidine kinase
MSHRVKNLLAIAASLTRITSRSSSSLEDMTEQLTSRLSALGRAHDLVRPLAGQQGKTALLGDIFSVLLAPYDDEGAFAGRIRVAVPRMGVGKDAATALALIVHELATNSMKYGSLSAKDGTLDVSGSIVGENVQISWSDNGGPEIEEPKTLAGYGTTVLRRSVEDQLDGTVSYEWAATGALVTLRLPLEQLSR